MTEPTIWPARRVNDRVLCGRMVDGRHVCQGEIGRIVRDPLARYPSGELVALPAGMMAVALGSTHWVPNARGGGRGRRLGAKWHPVIRYPWTRACSHCGCVARVDAVVLQSED